MSQSGYTPIQLYYSTTASNTPSTSNLKLGELAFNIADNKIYALNTASNAIQTVVGTLGNQNKTSVSITGGAIDGTMVGATTASTGAFTTLTATTPIGISSGGTNSSATPTSGGVGYGTGTAHAFTAAGTSNQVLISNGSSAPTWSSLSSIGVSSFSAGTTGLTPSSATTGAISLGGTLNVANGGTGLTSLTANYIPYGNGTSAFSSSSAFTYNGTALTVGQVISPTIGAASSTALSLQSNGTTNATLDTSGNFCIGTTSGSAKFHSLQTSAARNSILVGNSTAQGLASEIATIVRYYPVVSLGTKLLIPFVNQSNLNLGTICRLIGLTAQYNTNVPYGFTVNFAVGHVNSLSNLSSWDTGGNFASIAINSMNIEITFTTAYSGGIFVTLEYMTGVLSYSIDVANIAMN